MGYLPLALSYLCKKGAELAIKRYSQCSYMTLSNSKMERKETQENVMAYANNTASYMNHRS